MPKKNTGHTSRRNSISESEPMVQQPAAGRALAGGLAAEATYHCTTFPANDVALSLLLMLEILHEAICQT